MSSKVVAAALTAADGQPQTTFEALATMAQDVIGTRLFTLMTFDAEACEAQRIYSNRPDVYPIHGTKPVNDTYWTNIVLDRQETFVANDIGKIAEVFFDHEVIRSLGCESALNVPVIVAGAVLGTINCLHEAGHYTPERVRASELLKLPGAAAFLLARTISAKGA